MLQSLRCVTVSASLLMLLSCGGQSNFRRGGDGMELTGSGTTRSSADARETPTLIVTNESKIESSEPEASAEPNASQPQLVSTDSDGASEPIAVGGAYLTCRYPQKQVQFAEDWSMTCQISGLAIKDKTEINAHFAKLDGAGKSYPLTITSFDRQTLTWVLAEKSATVPFVNVLVSISFDGAKAIDLKTVLSAPIALTLDPLYWLYNEPNDKNGNEDCVEFVNDAEKRKAATPVSGGGSGVVSGAEARFNDRDCPAVQPYLCRYTGSSATAAKWKISGNGPYAAYANACPTDYSFSIPYSLAESREVATLVNDISQTNSVTIWVSANDIAVEKSFVIILK